MKNLYKYYVNQNVQANGDHEVHREGCAYLPDLAKRIFIGLHESCHNATLVAKGLYPKANGCFYCSNECHTS